MTIRCSPNFPALHASIFFMYVRGPKGVPPSNILHLRLLSGSTPSRPHANFSTMSFDPCWMHVSSSFQWPWCLLYYTPTHLARSSNYEIWWWITLTKVTPVMDGWFALTDGCWGWLSGSLPLCESLWIVVVVLVNLRKQATAHKHFRWLGTEALLAVINSCYVSYLLSLYFVISQAGCPLSDSSKFWVKGTPKFRMSNDSFCCFAFS